MDHRKIVFVFAILGLMIYLPSVHAGGFCGGVTGCTNPGGACSGALTCNPDPDASCTSGVGYVCGGSAYTFVTQSACSSSGCAPSTTFASGTSITFYAECYGSECSGAGPTDIYDYGSQACPTSFPATQPATCAYGDISTTGTPCLVKSKASPSLTATITVSSSSSHIISHNLCALSETAGGPVAATLLTFSVGSASSGGGTGPGGSTSTDSAIAAICNVYTTLNVIVFILALTLMILGGALYAGAQILPGSVRGQVQGYAMGMILGGVAGAVIAVLAPWILSIVYNSPTNTILAVCSPT